jgi:hypothetical protein
MRKIKLIALLLSFLPVTVFASKVQAQEPCSFGGVTTTTNIRNQMSYPDEEFTGLTIASMEQLNNLSQLSGLTCLQYMDFYKSDLKGDLSDLRNLTNLVVFNMNNNPGIYGDVCALSQARNLRILRLAFNPQVSGDIACLKSLNLEVFAVTGTQISGDLADLSHMNNLKELYLGGTAVGGDVASLSKFTQMTELVISDTEDHRANIYGDLSSLDNLQKVWRARIYNTNTTNCDQFTKSHPGLIEGGCSQLSGPSAKEPIRESEKNKSPNSPILFIGLFLLTIILVATLKIRGNKKKP